ncbi:Fic family protein [Candidatus Woesearchaeota archaeon]|nr:Fic family protein [Candidatus Woesearchaeota archaeon]
MYLEKKRIGNDIYNYLKLSVRYKDKVRTKTIAYLGKGILTKDRLKRDIAKFKSAGEGAKKKALAELKTELDKEIFLTVNQLDKIKYAKEDFNKRLKGLDERTKQDMFNDFITLYAYNTNAIEGNTFSLRDTDLLLNKGITPQGKTLREVNDHLNAKEAFELILRKGQAINHNGIIHIHSVLMKNIDSRVGAYRVHNVRVFGARFHTSPAEYVRIDMDILLKWYRKNRQKLHPLALAAIFHHKFEKIHPFYDGNGRTGRMLLNLILLQNHLPPLIVPDAQRKRYYNALSAADETHLNQTQPECKEVVNFCYFSFLKTFSTVFSRWG